VQSTFVAEAGVNAIVENLAFVDTTFRLVDQNGESVQAATIQAYGSDRTWKVVATDSSTAEMNGLLAGNTYYYQALLHGQWARVTVVPTVDGENIYTAVVATSSTSLEIVNQNGDPAVAQRVQLYSAEAGWQDVGSDVDSVVMSGLTIDSAFQVRSLYDGQWTSTRFVQAAKPTTLRHTVEAISVMVNTVGTDRLAVAGTITIRVDGREVLNLEESATASVSVPTGADIAVSSRYRNQTKSDVLHAITEDQTVTLEFDVAVAQISVVNEAGAPLVAELIELYTSAERWHPIATDSASVITRALRAGVVYEVRATIDGKTENVTWTMGSDSAVAITFESAPEATTTAPTTTEPTPDPPTTTTVEAPNPSTTTPTVGSGPTTTVVSTTTTVGSGPTTTGVAPTSPTVAPGVGTSPSTTPGTVSPAATSVQPPTTTTAVALEQQGAFVTSPVVVGEPRAPAGVVPPSAATSSVRGEVLNFIVEYGGEFESIAQVDLTLPIGATVAEDPTGWSCTSAAESVQCESDDPMVPGELRPLTLSLGLDGPASTSVGGGSVFASPRTILAQPVASSSTVGVPGAALAAGLGLLLVFVFLTARRRRLANASVVD